MNVNDISALKKTFPVTVTFCVIYLLEGVLILLGNIFTVFVFWKRRAELQRTSYLLVNLSFGGSRRFTKFEQSSQNFCHL